MALVAGYGPHFTSSQEPGMPLCSSQDEADAGWGEGLLQLTLLGTATGQEMRVSAKGPFAWDMVQGQTRLTFGKGPLEISFIYI